MQENKTLNDLMAAFAGESQAQPQIYGLREKGGGGRTRKRGQAFPRRGRRGNAACLKGAGDGGQDRHNRRQPEGCGGGRDA